MKSQPLDPNSSARDDMARPCPANRFGNAVDEGKLPVGGASISVSGLRIACVTRVLPTPVDPSQGIFVLNRLLAMSRLVDLTMVQPIPYFPVLKSLPDWGDQRADNLLRVPMFYLPGILKWLDAAWLARAVESTIEELHQAKALDAIDAHFGYPDGVACVEIGRRLQIPVVVTLRGVENEQLQTRRIGRRLREALEHASGCICVSHFLAELAIRNGVDERKIEVIHNSVDRSLFHPGPARRARSELRLPTDRPIVVSIGHIVPRKRHHVLIEAFADTEMRRSGAFLVILGSESHDLKYAARLRTMIDELGLRDSIRLVGNRPPVEIAEYLGVSDAFALLSAREGCCNAVLEALACGTPVLATDVGDNRFFVNSANGRLVGVDQPREAVEGLREVLTNRWDRNTVAKTLPVGDWNDVARHAVTFIAGIVSSSAAQSR